MPLRTRSTHGRARSTHGRAARTQITQNAQRAHREHTEQRYRLDIAVRKNWESHIDASHSRQPLVKGERLVRYEVNAVIPRLLAHIGCAQPKGTPLLADGCHAFLETRQLGGQIMTQHKHA